MAKAKVSRTDTKSGRFYDINGDKFPSVTTILGCIAKPALIAWAASTERDAVVAAAANLHARCLAEGLTLPESVYRETLKAELGKVKEHTKQMEAAGDIGSQVHARIEWTLRKLVGLPPAPEPQISDPALIAFMAWEDWAKSVRLEPLFIEHTVWSKEHRYAGTMDLLARINGVVTLVDWKSGKSVYAEAHLQNVAYRKAVEEMGLPAAEAGLIVRLPKTLDDLTVEPVPVTGDTSALFTCFLAARQVWAWSYEQERAYQQRRKAAKAA